MSSQPNVDFSIEILYTTDIVKLVRYCTFYLVHPDTKHLQEVTFYVASDNGSVLFCVLPYLHLA